MAMNIGKFYNYNGDCPFLNNYLRHCLTLRLIIIIINLQQLTRFEKQRILDQAFLSHYSAKNVLIFRHVLCVTSCTLEHIYIRGLLEKYPTVFFYANT